MTRCWSPTCAHIVAAGHPSARQVQPGTLSKLQAAPDRHPQRIRSYLQRKDPDFDRKMVQVLQVYQPVTLELDPAGGRPPDGPIVGC